MQSRRLKPEAEKKKRKERKGEDRRRAEQPGKMRWGEKGENRRVEDRNGLAEREGGCYEMERKERGMRSRVRALEHQGKRKRGGERGRATTGLRALAKTVKQREGTRASERRAAASDRKRDKSTGQQRAEPRGAQCSSCRACKQKRVAETAAASHTTARLRQWGRRELTEEADAGGRRGGGLGVWAVAAGLRRRLEVLSATATGGSSDERPRMCTAHQRRTRSSRHAAQSTQPHARRTHSSADARNTHAAASFCSIGHSLGHAEGGEA
eukprot:4825714-Pleurochrysis_carterae.AAC.5